MIMITDNSTTGRADPLIPDPCALLITNLISRNGITLYQREILASYSLMIDGRE